MLSRRRFLALAGGGVGAVAVGAGAWAALVEEQVQEQSGGRSGSAGDDRRVLVVVQCDGGNDGLNTVVPVADGRYRDLRPDLGLPEADLVPIGGVDDHAAHPALAPLLERWDAGDLAILQGIGFDGQSRSHFAAMDLWWSATPGAPLRTGWLGRWNDLTTADANPLRVISLGGRSEAVTGAEVLATRVNDPATFSLASPPGVTPEEMTAAFLATSEPVGGPALRPAQEAVPAAVDAVDLLARAAPASTADPGDDPEPPTATSLLETAAGIIGHDVGTRVVVVAIGGFDTHADQADRHAGLLADVAGGIDRFLALIEAQGRAQDVLVLTTSEFGRRAAQNGSAGTDHGNAGVLFACGAGVNGGLVGESRLGDLVEGDLPIVADTRSLYAVGLDWLGGPTDEILGGPFDRHDLLAS